MKNFTSFIKALLVSMAILLTTGVFAKTHLIQVRDFSFTPDSLTVSVGDSIVWHWQQGTHTTTSVSVPEGAASWDEPITEASPNYLYVVTQPGVYNYVCTPHQSLGMVGVFVANFANAVGDKNGIAPSISIFPNPFKESLSIRFETTGKNLDRIEIYDLTGKKIFEMRDAIRTGSDMHFTLAALDPGIYLLKFVDADNNSWARRINKQ